MAFKTTSIFEMYSATPILSKPRFSSGVNQYGLKPETTYDYLNPTQLVNFGAGTTMDTLNVRRAATGRGSSPSMRSLSIGDVSVRALGVVPDDPNAISFCARESTALRVCMAKGQTTCEAENSRLDACLGRVRPLKASLQRLHSDFRDWFIQNVSDNYTTPPIHQPHDHRPHYFNEAHFNRVRQAKAQTLFKQPKRLSYGANTFHLPGTARRSRLPVNK
jgi:hypothetical protein